MRFFLCCVRPSGAPVPEAVRARYLTAACCRGLDLHWRQVDGLWTLIHSDEAGHGGAVVRWRSLVGIGSVRLDNREELMRWTGTVDSEVSDLDLVVRLLAQDGERRIRDMLGDFAFVLWDTATRHLVAARDAFGVRPLYYAQQPDLIAFASRAELLASGEQYDLEYLVALAALVYTPPSQTVYSGVHAIPDAAFASLRRGSLEVRHYWSPTDFAPSNESVGDVALLYESFRDLLMQSVRLRVSEKGTTWSMLSGGLDSSSVVTVAQRLAQAGAIPCGLEGTVTWVDTKHAGADERRYVDAVVEQYGVRNERITDRGFLHDDDREPPLVDNPTYVYPFWDQARRMAEVVQWAGGRVLLTGYGGDHLVIGNMFFFADWVARGHVRRAITEMLRRAALGRVSFWELAYRNAVLPLLPRGVHRLVARERRIPPWITAALITRYGLAERSLGVRAYGGRIGRKYAHYAAMGFRAVSEELTGFSILADSLDVRHPYLFRPLVEFALRLPPELCVQPHARKWVLRQAMRGILPEAVRCRVGKGTLGPTLAESLVHKRDEVRHLLRDPILAQLGCADAQRLRAAVETVEVSNSETAVSIAMTLAIEVWLEVRSGQWRTGKRGKSNTA